jgi:GWxTD domain-containing protein
LKLSNKKIFICFFLLLFIGCETRRQYTSKPSKSIVNPDSDLIEVNAVGYHTSDSTSLAFIEVVNENLVYKRPDTSAAFYAELRISYKLLPEQGSRKILDSGSYYLNDRAEETVNMKSLKTMFQLKARLGNNYYLDVNVFDLNKRVKYNKGLNIYKVSKFSSQNFLVNAAGAVSFTNRFVKDQVVNVQVNGGVGSELTVDCFFREFPPPNPPFSLKQADELKYKPDSVFILPYTAGDYTLSMPALGFYHLRIDKSRQEGLTLYTFDETFPGVSNTEEMINCTRYIMSLQEFEQCKNANDQKEAIDKFWITIGGSKERARELLKRYYGRVKEANRYYTSYTSGWKTDRGMIFIMFGLPANIRKGQKTETWIYGVESNPNSMRYVFNKTNNPFSDNDYILERSQFYKDAWYNAADVWRNGHVNLIYDK